jgi:hypothetical protein
VLNVGVAVVLAVVQLPLLAAVAVELVVIML